MRAKLGTLVLFFLTGCSKVACPEPLGEEEVLLFITPLEDLTDGGRMEITIPQHYSTSDSAHTCDTWDLPGGDDEATDRISVEISRGGETVYADEWVQRCEAG